MSIPWALAVPVIIFIGAVVPLWIFFHYLTVWKRLKLQGLEEGQVAVDKKELRRLAQTAGRLEDRLNALETILDAESPGWRMK